MGLETPRVGSPFEAFVSFVAYCLTMAFKHLCFKAILRKCITQTHVQRQKLWSWLTNLKRSRLSWPQLGVRDKESQITAMMQHFVKLSWPRWTSNNTEASKLDGLQRLENCWTFNTFYQIGIRKTRKPSCEIWMLKAEFSKQSNPNFDDFRFKKLTPA